MPYTITHTDVVVDMNKHMRRNNPIIKVLPQVDHEMYAECEKIVKDFFSGSLNLEVWHIERAHRIVQRRPCHQWPAIVQFLNFKSKMKVLSNAPKL